MSGGKFSHQRLYTFSKYQIGRQINPMGFENCKVLQAKTTTTIVPVGIQDPSDGVSSVRNSYKKFWVKVPHGSLYLSNQPSSTVTAMV